MAQRSDTRYSEYLFYSVISATHIGRQGSVGSEIGFGIFQIAIFLFQSIPALSGHMSQRYGEQWAAYEKRVPYKLIPGIL